ncbi:MAG: stem cell self-renewal protein Piwi domain-containing protein [Desulfobacteraceae bacterium]|nr:MAG: stem cell self-renewal protein Piwi domain-containing protein [Desulfobacteraceae bacterium]
MPENRGLKGLRGEHPDWFLWWRDGMVYALPLVPTPSTTIGEQKRVRCGDSLRFLIAFIGFSLPKKFPKYDAFRRRPFSFIGRKDELVGVAAKQLRKAPTLLKAFAIRPAFTLEAKIVEPTPDNTIIGLFLRTKTKWAISADLNALAAAGVDLTGLCVVRRKYVPGERRLVGQISNVSGKTVHLAAAYDDRAMISTDEVLLEGSRASFARCLKTLLGRDYDLFENARQREEAKLLTGAAVNELLAQFHQFLQKDPVFTITDELRIRVNEQLAIGNTPEYESIFCAPPVQYYFNPARTKASQYPWAGLQNYGPFSKDTFPKRTPTILIVLPEHLQGATEAFLRCLRDGITTKGRSPYQGGFAKLFGLLNPSFITVKVLTAHTDPSSAYRRTIEEYLAASTTTPDAAIVVLADQHAALPDKANPYLVAKATLMLNGIPSQEIKASRLSKQPYELQYILQNFTIALYAKMNGTPWTVNQDTTISDELVIGIGTSELSTSRFDKRTRYIGLTTVFRGDGNYLLGHVSRDCTFEEYPVVLQETTERILEELKQRNGWNPGDNVRLIFHSFKPLKNVEVAEIAKRAALAVGDEQTIEFAFLTVTIDHSFLLLDPAQSGINRNGNRKAVFVPERGTIAQLGRYTRLVCTNGPLLVKNEKTPLPSPLLVHIHKGSTFTDLTYLSEQVLKFTGLSWRSTLPAQKPVSIYYSELIADLLSRLREVSGWSPAILNSKLRASRWFL